MAFQIDGEPLVSVDLIKTEEGNRAMPKRPRLSFQSDEHLPFWVSERSKSPPPIKRSNSLHMPLHESDSLVSPKADRDSIPMPLSCSGRKNALKRSQSLTMLMSRKSLDFSDDHSSGFVGRCFPERSSNSSEESLSSLSTESDVSRHDEEVGLKRYNKEIMLKRRRASSDSHEGGDSSKHALPSPNMVSHYSSLLLPVVDESDFVKQMSHLDVSQPMAPPIGSVLFPRHSFGSGALNSSLSCGPFETPTREQALILQCESIDATAVVAECKKVVRLVVFDLDQTLLDIHTKGRWKSTGKVLGDKHIRPVFRVLLPMLLRAGIPVGVATFSPQEEIVTAMLKHAFGADVRMEENVFVRGSREDSSKLCTQDEPGEDFHDEESDEDDHVHSGKRKHIECILKRMEDASATVITPRQVLFVDDDVNNTEIAILDGHRVVRFMDTWSDATFLKACLRALCLS